MRRIKIYVYLGLLALGSSLLAISCYTPAKISSQNIADIYRSEEHTLHPQFWLLHINDSVSQLYFKIDESELLYERKNPSDSFAASIRVYARVTMSYDSPLVFDSNSTVLRFNSSTNNKKEFAVASLILKLDKGGRFLVTVNTFDLNSKRMEVSYLEADKINLLGFQNFLVRDEASGHILFNKYFDTCANLAITYYPHPAPGSPAVTKLFVHYYKNNFPIAPPPFTATDNESSGINPDSTFVLYEKSNTFFLKLKSKGTYHLMVDSTDFAGLTLFRYDEHFPEIKEAYQMVAPLRYISSNEEFDKLTASKNPKTNVDEFWLTAAGGSRDRAKQLIHSYYNRIQDANRYFTSYLEGWKSDRGMIYLIFGAPSIISRTATSESWTYGEDRSYLSLSFTFLKMSNPFSDNDYALQRSANYRNLWYNAVDAWREGRVY